jgi:hypothetical protein
MGRLGMALCAVGLGGCALYQGPDQEPACQPTLQIRTMNALDVLGTGAQARTDALDIDGDGDADNQLGSIQASLYSAVGIPVDQEQTRVDRRLGTDVGWDVDLEVCPELTTATFPSGLPLGMLMDFADETTSGGFATVVAAQVLVADGRTDGLVGGALEPGYAHQAAVGLRPWAQQQRDAGNEVGTALDTNNDGTVTVPEIEATSIWQELMAPDLDLDGDGTAESLSFGYHVYFR